MKTIMLKSEAAAITGGLSNTSKMPCRSYSLPTVACKTGYRMAQLPGSICSTCYANRGNYAAYAANIEPAQHARLASLDDPHWVDAIVTLIGNDAYFRWHDSGDIQSLRHLEMIASVARRTPRTKHWLPTREYSMVKDYIAKHGQLPRNLIVRLSAMYIDKPVTIPASLRNVANVAASNVHTVGAVVHGKACPAPTQGNKCATCRSCWNAKITVSYTAH
jgi:hypothetical protein